MTNTIDTAYLLNSNQNKAKTGTSSLGKDDFLKILMTQLQNQDPLNPLQDKDFIAQMATFSTLEQITNLNTSIGQLVLDSQLSQSSQMIGKTLTYLNEENKETTAVVKSVTFKEGKMTFQLGDEAKTSITSSQIIKIE